MEAIVMHAPSPITLLSNPPSLNQKDDHPILESKAKYQKQLKKWQKRLLTVQQAYFHQKRRALIVMEGWDAAGKGGAIRRITEKLDPRGFTVYPISAPTPSEQGKHYLYRFQTKLPAPGHIAIFDRSWYGRVLVERVEQFASPNEWQRAYQEINEFERMLLDDNARIIKLFLNITLGDQSRVREYRYTDADFRHIRKTLYDHAGISLSDYKKDMAYNRLVRRIRALNLNGFAEYFAYLENTPDEFGQFINALTTNLTSFFRENHHFECLKNQILPSLDKSGQKRIRIWSAGCSVGEEPYSIAMSCQMAGLSLDKFDLKILATDIDSTVLATAKSGEYGLERIQSIPENYQKKFVEYDKHKPNVAIMSPKIRNMITFKELNLMQNWPMKGPSSVEVVSPSPAIVDESVNAESDTLAPHVHLEEPQNKEPGFFKRMMSKLSFSSDDEQVEPSEAQSSTGHFKVVDVATIEESEPQKLDQVSELDKVVESVSQPESSDALKDTVPEAASILAASDLDQAVVAIDNDANTVKAQPEKEAISTSPQSESIMPVASEQSIPLDAKAFQRSANWINQQPNMRYAIQLVQASQPDGMMKFIQEHQLQESAYFIHVAQDGAEKYVLLYGDYPNNRTSKAVAKTLPKAVQDNGYWIRTFGDLRRSYTIDP
jgi:chemotaxis methyl-accepting protein methylase/polyphosphate kinase 2 (PPK2 family)/septal ring-binding cell division protein DamX